MATVLETIINIRDNASASVNKLNRMAEKFSRSAKLASRNTNTFESAIKKVGVTAAGVVGVAALASGIKKIATSALDGASSMEGYRNTLNVVMKDQKKAAKTFAWAVDFANKTPFDTSGVIDATVKLQSYGLTAKDVMTNIGDMAGVMNKSLDDAVEAVADAQQGELERLKSFGVTKAQIVEHGAKIMRGKELVNNKGQITDQKNFNKALFSLMEGRFKGGMALQANSFKGIMSTIKGVWSTSLAQMMGISKTGKVKIGGMFDSIKKKTLAFSKVLQRWANDGTIQRWGNKVTKAFKIVDSVITGKLIPAFKITKNYIQTNLIPKFSAIGDELKKIYNTFIPNTNSGFDELKKVAKAVVDSGLNLVIDALKWIGSHKEFVVSAVKALTAVWVIQKGALIALSVWQGINKGLMIAGAIASGAETIAIVGLYIAQYGLAAALKVVTIAQAAFNFVLALNPIVLVVGLIALFVAGLVLLYKKSETARNAMNAMWNGLKSGAETAINAVVEKINWLIEKINKIPGINIGTVGKVNFTGDSKLKINGKSRAMGESYVPRDNTPYMLHQGEKILNAREARENKGTKGTFTIAKLADTIIVREEADIDKIIDGIVKELDLAAVNMA